MKSSSLNKTTESAAVDFTENLKIVRNLSNLISSLTPEFLNKYNKRYKRAEPLAEVKLSKETLEKLKTKILQIEVSKEDGNSVAIDTSNEYRNSVAKRLIISAFTAEYAPQVNWPSDQEFEKKNPKGVNQIAIDPDLQKIMDNSSAARKIGKLSRKTKKFTSTLIDKYYDKKQQSILNAELNKQDFIDKLKDIIIEIDEEQYKDDKSIIHQAKKLIKSQLDNILYTFQETKKPLKQASSIPPQNDVKQSPPNFFKAPLDQSYSAELVQQNMSKFQEELPLSFGKILLSGNKTKLVTALLNDSNLKKLLEQLEKVAKSEDEIELIRKTIAQWIPTIAKLALQKDYQVEIKKTLTTTFDNEFLDQLKDDELKETILQLTSEISVSKNTL